MFRLEIFGFLLIRIDLEKYSRRIKEWGFISVLLLQLGGIFCVIK